MGSSVCYDSYLIVPDHNARFITDELLIDFRELLGEHSGENMAEVVWETLVMYGIEGRVDNFRVIKMNLLTDVFLDPCIYARQCVKQ